MVGLLRKPSSIAVRLGTNVAPSCSTAIGIGSTGSAPDGIHLALWLLFYDVVTTRPKPRPLSRHTLADFLSHPCICLCRHRPQETSGKGLEYSATASGNLSEAHAEANQRQGGFQESYSRNGCSQADEAWRHKAAQHCRWTHSPPRSTGKLISSSSRVRALTRLFGQVALKRPVRVGRHPLENFGSDRIEPSRRLKRDSVSKEPDTQGQSV